MADENKIEFQPVPRGLPSGAVKALQKLRERIMAGEFSKEKPPEPEVRP
jgi:hypothetical protein